LGVQHDGVWGESGERQRSVPGGAALLIRARETTLLGQLVDALLGQLYPRLTLGRLTDASVPAGCVAITAPGEPSIVFVFERQPQSAESWVLGQRGVSSVLTVTSTRQDFEQAVDRLLAGSGLHVLPGLLRMGYGG
jgi:hypothetical protein